MEEIISSYTRKEALDDGYQICLSTEYPKLCSQFYSIPIYITKTVWDRIVDLDAQKKQKIRDSLFDLLYMSINSPEFKRLTRSLVEFKFFLPFEGTSHSTLVTLMAECGAIDMHDPRPCITIMYPEER